MYYLVQGSSGPVPARASGTSSRMISTWKGPSNSSTCILRRTPASAVPSCTPLLRASSRSPGTSALRRLGSSCHSHDAVGRRQDRPSRARVSGIDCGRAVDRRSPAGPVLAARLPVGDGHAPRGARGSRSRPPTPSTSRWWWSTRAPSTAGTAAGCAPTSRARSSSRSPARSTATCGSTRPSRSRAPAFAPELVAAAADALGLRGPVHFKASGFAPGRARHAARVRHARRAGPRRTPPRSSAPRWSPRR